MIDDEGMDQCMFICGAQSTPDDDMLPGSFTVFPKSIGPDEATKILMRKIIGDLEELEIEHAEGSLTFEFIHTWEEFAAIELSDEVKMRALVTAVTQSALSALDKPALHAVLAMPWVPLSPTGH